MPKLVTMLLAAGLGLGLVACGGGSDDEGGSASGSETRTTETTAVRASGSGNAYCSLADKYRDFEGANLVPGGDVNALKVQLDTARAAMKDSVAVAPSEIKDDVALFADAYGPFVEVLSRANYDLTRVNLEDPAFVRLQAPELVTAAQHIADYIEANCGAG